MSPEAFTVIGTGIAIIAVVLGSIRPLHARMERLENGVVELRERMAKLEGLIEGLRESVAGRRAG